MAGGSFANEIPCMVCMSDHARLVKAVRIHEGVEDDQYCCEQGHTFGVDWRKGPATEPQWPPSAELLEAFEP